MNLTVAIGKNIRHYRLLKGLKLETLAREVHISKATMSQIENGQTEITISRIEKIATALSVEYNLLVTVKVSNNTISDVQNADGSCNTYQLMMEKAQSLIEDIVRLKGGG